MAKLWDNNPFPTLEGYKNINLTTFRKSGEPMVTPVWYVVVNGRIYVRTGANSGKVKRIRNTLRVLLRARDGTGRETRRGVGGVSAYPGYGGRGSGGERAVLEIMPAAR